MYAYIHNSIFDYVELPKKLDSKSNIIASDWEGYQNGGWLLLSPEQIAFKEANPTAGKQEVWEMEMIPTPVRTIEDAKREKLDEIDRFDADESGEGVNNFLINGLPVWICAEKRSVFRTSLDAAELLGEDSVELNLAGMFFSTPIQHAKIMLAKIQRYADKAAIVTARHKQAVEGLETITEVDNYNYMDGYPEKESFTIEINQQ